MSDPMAELDQLREIRDELRRLGVVATSCAHWLDNYRQGHQCYAEFVRQRIQLRDLLAELEALGLDGL